MTHIITSYIVDATIGLLEPQGTQLYDSIQSGQQIDQLATTEPQDTQLPRAPVHQAQTPSTRRKRNIVTPTQRSQIKRTIWEGRNQTIPMTWREITAEVNNIFGLWFSVKGLATMYHRRHILRPPKVTRLQQRHIKNMIREGRGQAKPMSWRNIRMVVNKKFGREFTKHALEMIHKESRP